MSETGSSLRKLVHPLTGATSDFDPLLEQIGEARFVLLGEPHAERTSSIAPALRSPSV